MNSKKLSQDIARFPPPSFLPKQKLPLSCPRQAKAAHTAP